MWEDVANELDLIREGIMAKVQGNEGAYAMDRVILLSNSVNTAAWIASELAWWERLRAPKTPPIDNPPEAGA